MSLTNLDPKLPVQKINLDDDDLKLRCPFSMIISGPSQAGKSSMLLDIVKFRKEVCSQNFSRIIYCQSNSFSLKNQLFIKKLQEQFPTLELHQGLPKISELNLTVNNVHALLLVDDLMEDVLNSLSMVHLVSNDVHNYNISVIFVLQNYFAHGKYGKTLVRNCHYRVFFYNRIEQLELRNISSQISTYPNFFQANFEYLCKRYPQEKSHYLLIDGHFLSPANKLWCRSHIFPQGNDNKITPIVFFPNPDYKKDKK